MNFHTILYRELIIAARRPGTYYVRIAAGALAAIVAAATAISTVRGMIAPDETGRMLFWALGAIGLVWALLEGLMLTVDCISSERRDGTLGLLFLSNLSARDIIAGKIGAAGLRTLFALLAASTAPALTFIFGGVTLGQYLQLVFALVNALFFALCLGVLLSCLANERRTSQARAVALFLWFVVASPALGTYLYFHKFIASALLFAPGPIAPFLVIFAEDANLKGAFAATFAISNFIAWTLFATAARRLAANWRDVQIAPQEALILFPRPRLRHENPILTLALRHSPGFQKFRAACVAIFLAGCIVYFLAPSQSLPAIFGGLLLAMHLALSAEVASAASRLLAESRQTGLLELLLTTPLREEEIAAGHLLALKRSVAKALGFLALAGLLWISFLWRHADAGTFSGAMLAYVTLFILHLSDLWFNCRVGLWQGLAKGNPNRAYRSTGTAIALTAAISATLTVLMMFSVANVIPRENLPLIASCASVLAIPAIMSAWFITASFNLTDKMRVLAATPIGLTSSPGR